MTGELEDASAILGGRAWTTARRITIPLALPALIAGSLIAFLQAMTLFGSPAILRCRAGFHTMTTKIWSLFQYPPQARARRRRRGAAAAAEDPAAAGPEIPARPSRLLRRGGKYGAPRQVELNRWRWVALAFCLIVLLNPVFLPYLALLNAAFSPNANHAGDARNRNAAQHRLRFHRIVVGATRGQEHRDPRRRDRDHRDGFWRSSSPMSRRGV